MRKTLLFVLLLFVGAEVAAHADARSTAREHFLKGEAAQAAGHYDEAITEYQAAYELAPLPGLLFNLGQVYRLSGNKAEALAMYEKFIAAQPASGPIAEAQRHVAELSASLDAERALAEREQAEKARATPAPAPVSASGAVSVSASVSAPVSTPSSHPGRTLRLSGLIAASLGVVSLGAAAYFEIRTHQIASDLSDPTKPWSSTLDQEARIDGPAAQRNFVLTATIGTTAVVAGVVLYAIGVKAGHTTVVPMLGHEVAGAALVGRF